jgi:hypothetical protein
LDEDRSLIKGRDTDDDDGDDNSNQNRNIQRIRNSLEISGNTF